MLSDYEAVEFCLSFFQCVVVLPSPTMSQALSCQKKPSLQGKATYFPESQFQKWNGCFGCSLRKTHKGLIPIMKNINQNA